MKYPKMQKSNLHRAEINNLSGGLNTKLSQKMIALNEQSEIKNMFWKDNALCRRPTFEKQKELEGYTVTDVLYNDQLFIYKSELDEYGEGGFYGALIDVQGAFTPLNELLIDKEYENEEGNFFCAYSFFPFCMGKTLYLGIGYKEYKKENFLGKLYKLCDNEFILIDDSEIYAPLIMINGKGNKYSSLALGTNAVFSPQISFEGVNLLTKRVRTQYTTDGASYSFPFLVGRKSGTPVKVKLTGSFNSNDSIEEISFTINDEADIVKVPNHNDISCFISNYTNLTFRKGDNSPYPPLAAAFSNNLELEYFIDNNPNAQSFFEMGLATVFGGSNKVGGNRIFIAGNKSHPNLLRWSDINNPLYFPENNFAFVSDGEILALKKQGNMLLIFSDNEIHYTKHLSGSYTASDFLNGYANDITAISSLFPITQLHGELGLYSKNAATLMDNKIIFLGSDKRLYRIEGGNTITYLSQKIENFLKEMNITDLCVGKFKDYFMLITDVGTVIFNTLTHGFYFWEERIENGYVLGDEKPVIIAKNGIYTFNDNLKLDFSLTTAYLDFNYPERYKKLHKIVVLGDEGEVQIVGEKTKTPYRKFKREVPIFVNLSRAKNFYLKFKNCNNLKGIIFYYTLY